MSYTPGQLPLGAVIATFPHLTNAYQCSATTTPDSKGFVLCQGQTLALGSMAGAVVPNINNNAFLRGNSTSSNTINSSASRTLTAANIPSLTSTGSTTGTGSTVANTSGNQSADHTHTYSGTTGLNNSSLSHDHNYSQLTFAGDGQAGSPRFCISGTTAASTSGNMQTLDHTHSFSGTTAGVSANHNHSIPSLTVNSGISVSVSYSNSASSFNIEPSYINAVYLMRVN